jgi:parallel beta-helix repeat protein
MMTKPGAHTQKRIPILCLLTILLLAAPAAHAATNVSGTISTDTVWTLVGSPYIVTGSITVQGTDGPDGVTTLTIEPGVVVRFNQGAYLTIGSSSSIPGELLAVGTQAAPIRFTANTDNPVPGYWYFILLGPGTSGTTRLEHCVVEFAGLSNQHAVGVSGSAIDINNCRFENNAGYDLHYSGTVGGSVNNSTFNKGINFAGSGQVAFSGNTVNWNNNYPVRMPADNVHAFVADTIFTNLDSSSALQVTGSNLTRDSVWKSSIPYSLGSLFIQGTYGGDGVTTLTLTPGVEIRMSAYAYLYVGQTSSQPGALVASGTQEAPIRFTANSVSPAPGYWYYILFGPGTSGTTRLEHCVVEFAGLSNQHAVGVSGSEIDINNCHFENNAAYDLHYSGTVGGSVSNSTFNKGVNFAGSGQVAFSGNTINWNNNFPVRMPADNVHAFVADTVFTNLDSSSALQVTGSNLTRDSVWRASIPYFIGSTMYIQGTDGGDSVTTLTLAPGSEFRMGPYIYLIVGQSSGNPGALVAVGTPEAPIRFTTNNAMPAPGQWRQIQFNNTAYSQTTRLEHCIIEYAGYGTDAVQVYGSSPTFAHCRFENNAGYDLTYSSTVGGAVSNCTFNHGINFAGSGQVAFSGNTVNWNNNFPVRMPADNVHAFVVDTVFTNLGSLSAVQVTTGNLSRDAFWRGSIPYAVSGQLYVQGTDGDDGITTLTLAPGAELRINRYQSIVVGSSSGYPGALIAAGTDDEPVRFTANAMTPTAGFWRAIQFERTADDTSRLEYCIVEYGGYGANQIYIDRSAPALRYNTIRNSGNRGICISGAESSGAVIECNNLKDNVVGILVADNSQPTIAGNNFINNRDYGLLNSSSLQVTALNNWWGHAEGPNFGGDKISGNIGFNPWREMPSDCVSGVPINDPPYVPQNPLPAVGATGVNFPNGNVALSWAGGDPNPSDTITHTLMWGTHSGDMAVKAQGISGFTHTVGGVVPDTTYYWQIVTTDNHGAFTSGPVWHFSTANPQPDLIVADLTWTPQDDIVAGQQVTFTATVQNSGSGATTRNFGVAFQVNSQRSTHYIYQNLAAGQSAQVSYQWTAQVGEAFTITVEADSLNYIPEDNETNNTRSASLGAIPDITPPQLSNMWPADGSTVQQVNQIGFYLYDRYGGSVDTNASAATIVLTRSGQPVAGSVTASSNWFYFTPASIPLPDGVYQVALTAHDTAGNSQAYTFGFTVDNMIPETPAITGGTVTSGLIQPRPAQNRSNQSTITLTGTREDGTRIVVNGTIYVNAGNGPWSANIGLPQGDNALEVRAYDAANNRSEPAWVDIYVDSIPPSISGFMPPNDSLLNSVPASIQVNFVETGSGIDSSLSEHVLKDGILNPVSGAWSESAAQLDFVPAAPLSDDIYTVEVRLTDKMGNVSSLRRAMFTVDTDAPPAPQIDPVVTPTHSVHQVISGRKEAYAAILLNDTQVIAHTASIVWQHTVTLSSGSNVLNFTARDRAGNVSAPAQATILYDDVPPPPVTALTASGQGSGTTVFLNWSGYNEILHGDIQSYRIFRETAVFSTIDGLSPQATVSLGTQTYLVRDLNPGTTYWFAVVAVDRTGNFIAAVTPVPASPSDSLAPENITGLTVQSFADRLVFTWQPSANTQGDLAGYKVYFNGVAAADNLPAGQTSYERTGLSPSSAYPVKVSAYDTQNNESTGVTLTGYTWLDNPAGLTAEPYNGYVQLNWSAVAPAANLKHYAVYAQAEVFNSVEGLVPVLTVSATQSKVAGLTNNQNYFFAVTAVNRSSGERPGVTSVAAQPAPDEQGPQLTNVLIDGQPLVSGRTLTRPANITLNASDPSGVGRVEFRLNAETVSISTGAPLCLRAGHRADP